MQKLSLIVGSMVVLFAMVLCPTLNTFAGGGNDDVPGVEAGKLVGGVCKGEDGFTTTMDVRVRKGEDLFIAGDTSPGVDLYVIDAAASLAAPLVDVSGGVETVTANAKGNISGCTVIWAAPLTSGSYRIVADANQDGSFTAGIDAIDAFVVF